MTNAVLAMILTAPCPQVPGHEGVRPVCPQAQERAVQPSTTTPPATDAPDSTADADDADDDTPDRTHRTHCHA